jgi:TetR/AcrR family transcriptional regulator
VKRRRPNSSPPRLRASSASAHTRFGGLQPGVARAASEAGSTRYRRSPRRDARRTRETILAAAQDEFARKGLSGGRVDEIARRARVNKRMIYHYFGSKEGIYLAALERVYEDLRGSERTLELADLAPEAAIRRLIEFNFDYCRHHPELISLINNENLHRARHLRRSRKVR